MGLLFLSHPLEMILAYVFLVLSFGLHEAAHAKVAGLYGDTRPYQDGVDSWNPLVHIRRSIFSSVILPAITWFLAGFFIGGAFTRLNPAQMRPRRLGHAAAVAAGPLMNLFLAIVSGLFAVLAAALTGKPASAAVMVISLVGSFNFFGFVFNLLPLPPLDGSSLLRVLFPSTERFFRAVQGFPLLIVFFIGLQFSALAAVFYFPVRLYVSVLNSIILSLGF
jgi:Zn-dependent protease